MNKVELITVVWIMWLPLILVCMLVYLVTTIGQRVSPKRRPWWFAPVVSVGATIALAVVLFSATPTGGHFRLVLFPLGNGLLLVLTLSPFIILLGIGTWRIRSSARRPALVAYLCGVLLCGVVSFVPARYFFEMVMFERAISSALDGEVESDSPGRFQLECRWDCENKSWIRDLPPLANAQCTQSLIPSGACCSASFLGGGGAEIHVFRAGFRRYSVSFYSAPVCPNPAFDPGAQAGSPESKELVRCDVDWDS